MLFTYWFLLHFLLSLTFVFSKRYNYFISLIFLTLMLFLYISKNVTVDLKHYYAQFTAAGVWWEPGWGYFSMVLSKIFSSNPYLVHFAYQIFSLLLIFSLSKKFYSTLVLKKTNYYFLVPAISLTIYTVFYFLGSQNILRQFIASILCLYAFYFGQKNKWFSSFLIYFISVFFHLSSAIIIPIYFLMSLRVNQKLIKYFLSFFAGLVMVILIFMIFRDHPQVAFYIEIQDHVDYKSRSTYFKFFALSFSLFFTHFLFTRTPEFKFDVIKKFLEFRFAIYFLALPLVFFELWTLWTRITVIIYFLELLLMLLMIYSKTSQRYRFVCALLILSYGIAPNVKNILSAPGLG